MATPSLLLMMNNNNNGNLVASSLIAHNNNNNSKEEESMHHRHHHHQELSLNDLVLERESRVPQRRLDRNNSVDSMTAMSGSKSSLFGLTSSNLRIAKDYASESSPPASAETDQDPEPRYRRFVIDLDARSQTKSLNDDDDDDSTGGIIGYDDDDYQL